MTAKATSKTLLQMLTEAKALISAPEHWTQGAFYRYANGVSWSEDGPCSFCAVGALGQVALNDLGAYLPLPPAEFLAAAISAKTVLDVVAFNDSHDHQAVLAMYDRAIVLAKQDEARKARAT